jgi:hypothetical protein
VGFKTLLAWQEEDVTKALEHNSWFNTYEMSLGKTLTTVEWARRKGAETILVVCPLNTRHSWESTIKGQIPDAYVRRIGSGPEDITSMLDIRDNKPGWYLISWEMMRQGAVVEDTFDLIVADETHKQANYGKSDQARMIRKINSKYKIALSGTPSANRPDGIFSTLNWLWPEQYKSMWNWVDTYWIQRRNGAVVDLIREINPGQIIRDIPMFTRRLRKDHMEDMKGVAEPIIVDVALTAAQRKIYDQFDDLALAWIGDTPVGTPYPLTQDIRLKQVALGNPTVVKDEYGQPVVTFKLDAKSSKIEALLEIIKDQPEEETFLVLVHSAKFVPTVVHQLRKKGIMAEGFAGNLKESERERILTEFGTTFRVMVAGIAKIGEGTDGLQYVCHNMIWMSKHANALLNTQAGARLDRPGQKELINVWEIRAINTRDWATEERLSEIKYSLDTMIDA